VAGNGLGLFLTGLPPALTIDFAGRAESAGWETAWFPEITFGDSFGPATAAALQTERLGIATGVVGVWSRSAVTMALQAATLHQLGRRRDHRQGAGPRLRQGLARPGIPQADHGDEGLRDDPAADLLW
jgi:alkanesulfonate monooxygenase SsuD/methylene tetrahydromethanopterin reductase-like flavin-dependent oxidoreductase (luciferase family)